MDRRGVRNRTSKSPILLGLIGSLKCKRKDHWSLAFYPVTRLKKQVTRHDYLPSLPGDGEKWSEIVYGEENNILYWED